jgi:amino acid transporter
MTLLLTYMNYRGLHVVGGAALSTTAFIIAPFVLLCGLAAPHMDTSNWTKVDWGKVDWAAWLNVMFWNLVSPGSDNG